MEILICIWLLIISLCIIVTYWYDKLNELDKIQKELQERRNNK